MSSKNRYRPNYYQCGKCGHLVSEGLIERHINECQGGKSKCNKCKETFPAAEFLNHFKNCTGKKLEVIDANRAVPEKH